MLCSMTLFFESLSIESILFLLYIANIFFFWAIIFFLDTRYINLRQGRPIYHRRREKKWPRRPLL